MGGTLARPSGTELLPQVALTEKPMLEFYNMGVLAQPFGTELLPQVALTRKNYGWDWKASELTHLAKLLIISPWRLVDLTNQNIIIGQELEAYKRLLGEREDREERVRERRRAAIRVAIGYVCLVISALFRRIMRLFRP